MTYTANYRGRGPHLQALNSRTCRLYRFGFGKLLPIGLRGGWQSFAHDLDHAMQRVECGHAIGFFAYLPHSCFIVEAGEQGLPHATTSSSLFLTSYSRSGRVVVLSPQQDKAKLRDCN